MPLRTAAGHAHRENLLHCSKHLSRVRLVGEAFGRPEIHDVLIYDTEVDDIGVHAGSKGERDLYLRQIGQHQFGDPEYFPQADKFTLNPLIERGRAALRCDDVPGLDGVSLTEFHKYWGGSYKAIEIRKATDIFGALDDRHHLLAGGRAIGAVFKVKFAGTKRPRSVTIRPPNMAKYDRDDDSDIVETWLALRGFIKPAAKEQDEEAAALLESA